MANTIYFNMLLADKFNVNFIKIANEKFAKKIEKCKTKKDVKDLVNWLEAKYPEEIFEPAEDYHVYGQGFI